MDAQHSPSGFSIFPNGMVARNITFMQDTFSRKLVGESHPHLATKHPDFYTMVARVDIPYNPRVPVCFLYVGNLFILEDHEKFSDRQDQHPCDFTHKKRRCRIVPNMAEFLDRTSMMSYPHPAEFLDHRFWDRCHFIFKGYGILYQVLDAIAGEEIFVYYGDGYEQPDRNKEDYFVFDNYYDPPGTGLQFKVGERAAMTTTALITSVGAGGGGVSSSDAASETAGGGTGDGAFSGGTGGGGSAHTATSTITAIAALML